MKRILTLPILAVIGFAVTAFITPKDFRDGNFEGLITYSTVSTNSVAAQAAHQQTNSKCYIKGDKIKTVIGESSFATTTITDCGNPENYIILMDVNGSKYRVKNDKQTDVPDPVIKYTDETKTIAGYNCYKAEITVFIDSNTEHAIHEEVYYTSDISSNSCNRQYKGLKGFPLEWIAKFGAITRTTTAIAIDKQALSDDEFAVPPGYKLVTQEEMTQDIQKNMANKGK